MDINDRIARFQELCAQDPTNDMAFFSLAGALNQAGRSREAAEAYVRCTALNPSMSKAYQLAGAAFIACDDRARAAEVLTEGYRVATERGDLMPKKAMADLLQKLDIPLPEVTGAPDAPAAPAGDFLCRRTGRHGTQLPRPPFRGPVGAWIYESISRQTFDEWIALGTKIINELKLDLSRDEHEAVYDYGMRRFLGIDDDQYLALAGRPPAPAAADYRSTIDMILSRSGKLEEFGGSLHQRH